MTVPLPVQHVAHFARHYPGIWKDVDGLVEERGKAFPYWPKWCFLPSSVLDTAVAQAGKKPWINDSEDKRAVARTIGRQVAALATWRLTKGIYRVDRTVLDDLWETPISQEIPADVLFHIPEWCIYIETPGKEFFKQEMLGCFVYLDYDFEHGGMRLQFLVDTRFSVNNLAPFDVDIVPGRSLRDCMVTTWQRKAPGAKEEDIGETADTLANLGSLPQLVSVLLYICSLADEIRQNLTVKRPKPRKTRKGWRYFPAEKTTELEIGYRIGEFLRRQEPARGDTPPESGHHSAPSPHIRRAHWHLYWVGKGSKKDSSKRKPLIKWIHPVLVNAEKPEDLIPVVRRVSG